MRLTSHRVCLALCLITLGLYGYRLDIKPLWWDEGFSVYVAHLSYFDLLRATAADVHPPTYYLLLNAWIKMAGSSPFSLRFLSVFTGVLTIPLLYVSGWRLNGKNTAMLAAMLGAVAPFVLNQARETRMYSLGMTLVMVSTYAFLRILTDSPASRRWWILYIVSISLGVCTQYIFALIPVTHAVAMVVGCRHKPAILGRWLVAMMAVLALSSPWVVYASSQLRTLQVERIGDVPNLKVARGILPVFQRIVIGSTVGDVSEQVAVGVFTLLVLIGIVALFKRQMTLGIAMTLGAIGAVLVIAVVQYTPDEGLMRGIKLAFPGVPLLLLLAAMGVAHVFSIRYWIGITALLLITANMGRNVLSSYEWPMDASEDYRPLIAQVQALAQPDDALLTAYVWQDGYFVSYAPNLPLVFYRNTYDASSVSRLLGEIFSSHSRLWVVNYLADVHDTYNPLNEWLSRNTALAFDEWYGNTQLALFVRANDPPVFWSAHAAFEGMVELDCVPPVTLIRPGDVLSLDLRWRVSATRDRSYKVFVHLGQPDHSPIAQSDREPAGGFEPMGAWLPGQYVIDRRALLVPLNAPPGEYMVYVGIYDPQDNIRLQVLLPSGCDTVDRVCVSRVKITD